MFRHTERDIQIMQVSVSDRCYYTSLSLCVLIEGGTYVDDGEMNDSLGEGGTHVDDGEMNDSLGEGGDEIKLIKQR